MEQGRSDLLAKIRGRALWFRVLRCLDAGPANIHAIGIALGLDPAAASRLAQELAKAGMVKDWQEGEWILTNQARNLLGNFPFL